MSFGECYLRGAPTLCPGLWCVVRTAEELADDLEESRDAQADVFELLGAGGVGEKAVGNAGALDMHVL